ncbi:hypothetical protein F5051DRAFT_444530 [Lentinula edodes]|nr:hypothetical protein F5051DRAFT_444530 [Lentinula edodes]
MFSPKTFFIDLVAVVCVQGVSAATLAPATIIACSGSLNPPNGCVTIPVVSDKCIILTGDLNFLNKNVSNVEVPDGFVCSLYEECECLGSQNAHDVVVLTGGSWNMTSVPGIAGIQDFNDMTSSLTCSPV